VISSNRTFMPIRYITDTAGADIDWDGINKKVTIRLNLKTIELWIGSAIARINGCLVYIDPADLTVVPFIMDSRTFLPLRFISEVLGGNVSWSSLTKSIGIIFDENKIDDDVTWGSKDSSSKITIDDDVTWNKFERSMEVIDDEVVWMKDGRVIAHVKILTDPLYKPTRLIDPNPPYMPASISGS
jgi:hypothetical protein